MRKLPLLATLLISFSILTLSASVWASDFDAAMYAYDRQDYHNAAELFTDLAEQGDPQAQYMIGKMYANGEGLLKEYIKAYKWLYLAENAGIGEAAYIKNRLSNRMSQKRINEAKQLAADWQMSHEASLVNDTDLSSKEFKDRPTIKEVQKKLKEYGYYFGTIDGLSGPGTRNAIMVYQHNKGVREDGKVTKSLLDLMGITPVIVQKPPVQQQDNELASIKKELKAIIKKAKRKNSADPWLIASLEKLVNKEAAPWPQLVFHEVFTKTDYRGAEAWRVLDGSFRLEQGTGLVGYPDETSKKSDNIDELAIDILGILINNQPPAAVNQKLAQIERKQTFSNSFYLSVKTGQLLSTEALHLSSTRKVEGKGYRLTVQPANNKQSKLFFISGNDVTEIPSKVSPIKFRSDKKHTIEWTRDSNGNMVVNLDGQKLLTARDNRFSAKSFDTLTITHSGERIILEDIKLRDETRSE